MATLPLPVVRRVPLYHHSTVNMGVPFYVKQTTNAPCDANRSLRHSCDRANVAASRWRALDDERSAVRRETNMVTVAAQLLTQGQRFHHEGGSRTFAELLLAHTSPGTPYRHPELTTVDHRSRIGPRGSTTPIRFSFKHTPHHRSDDEN